MLEWKYKINLKEEWKAAKEGTQQLKNLVEVVIRKLSKILEKDYDTELEDIIIDFKMLLESEDLSNESFDEIWERLYDWADCNKKLWLGIH